MKILFSPSEAKHSNGIKESFTKDSFLFPQLFDKRMEIVKAYNEYILTSDDEKLAKLFGTKKEDILKHYSQDIFKSPTMKVIKRYDGVAFDYVKYDELNGVEQNYIDENVIIFSKFIWTSKSRRFRAS